MPVDGVAYYKILHSSRCRSSAAGCQRDGAGAFCRLSRVLKGGAGADGPTMKPPRRAAPEHSLECVVGIHAGICRTQGPWRLSGPSWSQQQPAVAKGEFRYTRKAARSQTAQGTTVGGSMVGNALPPTRSRRDANFFEKKFDLGWRNENVLCYNEYNKTIKHGQRM